MKSDWLLLVGYVEDITLLIRRRLRIGLLSVAQFRDGRLQNRLDNDLYSYTINFTYDLLLTQDILSHQQRYQACFGQLVRTFDLGNG